MDMMSSIRYEDVGPNCATVTEGLLHKPYSVDLQSNSLVQP